MTDAATIEKPGLRAQLNNLAIGDSVALARRLKPNEGEDLPAWADKLENTARPAMARAKRDTAGAEFTGEKILTLTNSRGGGPNPVALFLITRTA